MADFSDWAIDGFQSRTLHFVPAPNSPQGVALNTILTALEVPDIPFSILAVLLPPGVQSRAHSHPGSTIVVCAFMGNAVTLVGDDMRAKPHRNDELVIVPAGVPHASVNLSLTEPVLGIELRTDPLGNADVLMLPELDELAGEVARRLREEFSTGPGPVLAHGLGLGQRVALPQQTSSPGTISMDDGASATLVG
ncbi:hypothetical protein ACPPVT_03400 [Angustibacter sp. McL0619]|uniref:hypothetical protein n=1 Tax=Angustibacter sp. McL0619 TaxID=3415676 RepID=UPI003CF24D38